VIVVGAGNAALAEATSARERGAERVLVPEKASEHMRDGAFDPSVKDGLATEGLTPSKSNWALALDTPPYHAYPVTGGITFTFGGVRVDAAARVLDTAHEPIAGLFACGEMVGGLFHHNYPGGAGLVSGAVFGRIAGASAAGNR
jgi:tricarballylate dehydrogenase